MNTARERATGALRARYYTPAWTTPKTVLAGDARSAPAAKTLKHNDSSRAARRPQSRARKASRATASRERAADARWTTDRRSNSRRRRRPGQQKGTKGKGKGGWRMVTLHPHPSAPPDTLHLPAPLPAPLPLPKTRELGNLLPKFHWMGAPPWQASVAACLGSPWDPTGLVSGLLGLVSSRASRRPSRNAHTLDSPAPLPSPAPFPRLGTLHPYPRRVNTGKRVPPLPFCCPVEIIA